MAVPEIRAAIDAANVEFMDAFEKRDVDALLRLYATDAIVLQPDGSKYSGSEEIKSWLTTLVDRASEGERLLIDTVAVFDSGEGSVVEDGSWKHVSAEGATVAYGNYVAIWCENEGSWQVQRDVILAG